MEFKRIVTGRDRDGRARFLYTDGPAPRTAWSAFRLGLFTQLANPKIAVFFGAVFVGMVPRDAPIWVLAAILAMIFLDEMLWYAFVGRVFSLERVRALYARVKRWIDRAFGALIAAFAIRIIVKT